MSFQQFKYLDALARHRHFGRASVACNVTQPTLSAGIRALEQELGTRLVHRTHRFEGLTAEGERVLAWAQRMLFEWENLRGNLLDVDACLSGRLRLGTIPTALPAVSVITERLCQQHPNVSANVLSMTSNQILEGLEQFRLDIGLTYLNNEPLPDLETLPLYRERYVLLTPRDGPFGARRTVTWQEAATLRLCLLNGDMQNRRIIDGAFHQAGADPTPRVDTNSIVTLCAHIHPGGWSSVLPAALLSTIVQPAGAVGVPLVEPELTPTVGFVTRRTELPSRLITAAWSCARDLPPHTLTGRDDELPLARVDSAGVTAD
ncbi:LysR family transcriptional regulator [Rhodovibrio salinarum]|uniref:LysR family transcriptional regulator n=1 Tax=Rhodovibrio salinarum TaxID=1087 RepID=A0A934V0R2_9PROT|nr:LysR family transcriptional regulator [Rhodovibrio salinarum]MBK1698203.1 LysR family transcriptional regulator [Rhodovibrio salinarum]